MHGVLKASENANEGDDNEVRLEGMLGNVEKVQHLVKFSTPPIAVENKGNVLLHQLAAKNFIQEKQDGYSERNDVQELEEAKQSAISISKSANVVSKFTSFVAVDKDSNQPVSGPLRKQFVPSYQSANGSALPLACSPADFATLSQNIACTMAMQEQMLCCISNDVCGAAGGGAMKKSGFGFKGTKKSWNSPPKTKSKGFFSSLFGSAARPPPLPAATSRKSCVPVPDSMSQKTKDSPGALSVISLQKASGSWDLTDQLVSLCGTSRDALMKGCPKEIAVDTGEGKLLWATALALVLLMGKFLDQKDEWEMIAEKGSKWIKNNLPAGVRYENVLAAAATTVGVQVNHGQ